MSIKPMLTLRQASKRLGLTSSTLLRSYALNGRIPGAVRDPVSGWWLVPSSFRITKLPKKEEKLCNTTTPQDD